MQGEAAVCRGNAGVWTTGDEWSYSMKSVCRHTKRVLMKKLIEKTAILFGLYFRRGPQHLDHGCQVRLCDIM